MNIQPNFVVETEYTATEDSDSHDEEQIERASVIYRAVIGQGPIAFSFPERNN